MRELLKSLELEDEVIEKVMAKHGQALESVKPANEELEKIKQYEELQKKKEALEQQVGQMKKTLSSKDEELKNVEDLEQKVETYKLQNLKTNIAIQAGIPIDLADRLSGATEEEIKEDAEKIARFVQQNETLPLRTTEPEKVDPKEKAYADLVDKI